MNLNKTHSSWHIRRRCDWGRVEGDAYDVLTPEGLRVEVKSTGYLQAWAQPSHSRISFGSMKDRTRTPEGGESADPTLNADV